MTTDSHSTHVHAVPLKILIGVWALLCVLTWVTVLATKIDLGSGNIILAMAIAVVKSTAVALFFMHLLWDKRINAYIFVSALLFVALFISFALMDTKAYHADLIPGYAPEITAATAPGDAAGGGGAGQVAAGPVGIDRGRELYTTTCVVCHGENAEGKRELNSPALHQQEDWYLVAQLEKFRSGLRGADPNDITGAQMRPMAMALPDEQALHDVAEYIGTLSAPMPPLTLQADVAAGKAHYNAVCVACHGVDGAGMAALQSPSLIGQSDWYVAAQLTKFKDGIRGANPKDVPGTQMRAMSATLATDEMVQNVAAYVATLGR
ncbi:MAG: hypothetical protein DHS20C21_02610 [Gemmatimonadota bacterium]|nr:MAG: hypothetical protein DHS20C21_02610 [Gemmatimonadota bacterium]